MNTFAAIVRRTEMPLPHFTSRKSRLVAIALSGAGAARFVVSVSLWALLTGAGAFGRLGWPYILGHSAAAVLLLAGFLVAFWLAWKRLRISWVLILGALVVAAACFWYDVGHRRYQIRAWTMDGAYEFTYLTWWWYPESRIVGGAPNKRSGVDAGRALCSHMMLCWPDATHRGRSA
jgi:hypothetical protein